MQPECDLEGAEKGFDGEKLRLKKKSYELFFILVSSPQTEGEVKGMPKSQLNYLSESYVNFPKL